MDFRELKKYIYEKNLVETVLVNIKCHHVKYHDRGYYTAANIDGDNITAITVYNEEYLRVNDYTRNIGDNSDIINLVLYNLKVMNNNDKLRLTDASKYLHKLLGIKWESYESQKKFDPLAVFKKANKITGIAYELDEPDYLEDDTYGFQVGVIHTSWLKEGITQRTVDRFDIGYSTFQKRIIIPLKYWKNGRLLGYNRRTVLPNADELGIKKYLITYGYPKSINLYGLYENKKSITNKGYVTVFEAEKSVLKRHSRTDDTGVALQGHVMSREQCSIILGLDIKEVVIALDKDVPINEIRAMCDRFYMKRKVSYILDRWDLIGDKDSPADADNNTYKFLFDNRIQYDELEHLKFRKYMEGR